MYSYSMGTKTFKRRAIAYLFALFAVCAAFVHVFSLIKLILPYFKRPKLLLSAISILLGTSFYCYLYALFVNPGKIPDTPEWSISNLDELKDLPPLIEKKLQPIGDYSMPNRHIRTCLICRKIKPDRAHHCHRCNQCVLRMDHHCILLNNCIGARNHKQFVLMKLYALAYLFFTNILILIVFSDYKTAMNKSCFKKKEYYYLSVSTIGIITLFFFTMLLAYTTFCWYLIVRNVNTVEFIDKNVSSRRRVAINWSKGVYRNMCEVLGDFELLWLIPINYKINDGINFTPGKNKKLISYKREPEGIENLV